MERELMVTGIGGQGVQLATQVLARAAMAEGREVLLFGSYGADLPYILPEGEDVPLDSGGWTAGGSGASAQRPPSIGLGTGGLY